MTEEQTITEEQVDQVVEKLSEERQNNPDVVALDNVLNDTAENPLDIQSQGWVKSLASDVTPTPSPEDIRVLVELNKKLRKGEKFPVFNSLPPYFKTLFRKEAAMAGINTHNRQAMNAYAKMFIESFISDAKIDEAYNKFNNEMKEILQGKDLFESLLDDDLNKYTTKMNELIDKLSSEEGNEDKIDRVKKYMKAFEDAYDYDQLIQYLKDHPVDANRMKDNGKYIKRAERFLDSYIYKLRDKGYEISEDMKQSMLRFAGAFGLTYSQAARFFVTLCLYSETYLEETRIFYMYFALDILKKLSRTNLQESESQFVKDLTVKVNKAVNEMDTICNQSLMV